MTTIQFTSEISVEEIQQVGTDETLARAAWVSTGQDQMAPGGEPISPAKVSGLIRYLMKSQHGTPFEAGFLTVRVHAPIKVWREWHRHRVGFSFNETSGRYVQLAPIFYLPPRERPMIRPEGFRSACPAFEMAMDEEYDQVVSILKRGYQEAYTRYEELLALDVDRGLARDVLGVGIFSACWVSCNPRSLMHFLELRTDHPEAKRPSKPLHEIAVAAQKLEAIFVKYWPMTHQAWVEYGRCAP